MTSEDFKVVFDRYSLCPKDDVNQVILIESMVREEALKVNNNQLKRLAFNQERSYAEIPKKEV